jgi:hypothetical protein
MIDLTINGQYQAMNLTDFLLARISEEEERAMRDLGSSPSKERAMRRVYACQAKRELALRLAAERSRDSASNPEVLRLLSGDYVDHPDFDASWLPGQPGPSASVDVRK